MTSFPWMTRHRLTIGRIGTALSWRFASPVKRPSKWQAEQPKDLPDKVLADIVADALWHKEERGEDGGSESIGTRNSG